jgi:hypothetical protein
LTPGGGPGWNDFEFDDLAAWKIGDDLDALGGSSLHGSNDVKCLAIGLRPNEAAVTTERADQEVTEFNLLGREAAWEIQADKRSLARRIGLGNRG